MGTIYKRGDTYWIKYYNQGKPFYESSRSDKKMVAKKLLDIREGELAQGKLPGVTFERVKLSELINMFLTDYTINQKKSLERAGISVRHLKKFLGDCSVVAVNSAKIGEYVANRMEDGAANATINRELAALKRMLMLGAKSSPPKVDRVPHIPMLKENNVRKGFFEHGDFLALREALPEYLRGMVTFGYKTGCRKSEIADLQWSQVDMDNGSVTLNPGETKNDRGRTVYLDVELKQLLQGQRRMQKTLGMLSAYVFHGESGKDKIKDFRGAWETACQSAWIGKKFFHDLRRTAVRNLVRSGVPERVAMMISGHQTRSVFERYNIVSDDDLRMAANKQEAYLSEQTVTKTVTISKITRQE
jgi:integrase